MAKTKTKSQSIRQDQKDRDILRTTNAPLIKSPMRSRQPKPQKSVSDLLTEATTLLEQSQPELALPLAEEALQRLEEERQAQNGAYLGEDEITVPPVLILVAETQLSLGDVDVARSHFLRAISLDPDGTTVSAEPWLWLAQLSENGGQESIHYFTKANEILRREIAILEKQAKQDEVAQMLTDEKQGKLADALCAMAEVYMTDLSWEPDAEDKCEALVTEAMAVVPEEKSAGVLQCLASVRISQQRIEDAKTALARSLEVWKDDEENVPEFSSRISLARLLMETEMLEEANIVLDGLILEDDQSVEAWYLGGWCQLLLTKILPADDDVANKKLTHRARQSLHNCLRLYKILDYEDVRLMEHATELMRELDHNLGNETDNEEDEWEEENGEDGTEEDADIEATEVDEDVDMT